MATRHRNGVVQAIATNNEGTANEVHVRLSTATDALLLLPSEPQFNTTFTLLLHAYATGEEIKLSWTHPTKVIVGVRLPAE